MNKSVVPVSLLLIGLSACVELTPAGKRVHIITQNQAELVSQCQPLGAVSVSSADALRNTAAALSGDTAIMSHRDVGTSTIVRGDVFRCSAEVTKKPDVALTGTEKTDAMTNTESLRKANLCQSKGGAWISSQCVIPVE